MSGARLKDGLEEPEFWGYLMSDLEIYPLGWYEMKDFRVGFDKVLEDAYKLAEDLGETVEFPIRGKYVDDYMNDLQYIKDCMNGEYGEDY